MPSHGIPMPPTPSSQAYKASTDNRMSTASGMSGYGTSAIGALLTAPGSGADGDSAYDSDSEDEYAYDGSARARLRHQVSKQGRKAVAKQEGNGYLGTDQRVMSPVSDYSEVDRDGQRDTRAISGVWATASNDVPEMPTGARERVEELDAPSMAYAKGGDRRSVALRQVPQHYMRSIAGELNQASLSNAGGSDGRVSTNTGRSVTSPTPGPVSPMSLGRTNPTSTAKALSEEVNEQDRRREQESKVAGGSGIMKRQGEQVVDQYRGKRITIVDFPAPSFVGNKGDYAKAPGVGDISFDQSMDRSYDAGQSYQHQHQQQHQEHGPYDAYGNPSYPAASHPGPIASPHLHPMPAPSPSHSPMPTSHSLPTLHIPSHVHDHYPSGPTHTGGSFGQGSYNRLANSSPNLGPSGQYSNGHLHPHAHAHGGLTPPQPITIDLPPPQSPISPMLAAPPSARVGGGRHMQSANPSSMMLASSAPGQVGSVHSTAPNAAGAGGPFQGNANRLSISSTNESIRGFDFLKEKNALFRGGEEDILGFNPRGPQKRAKPGRSGLGRAGAASRLMTTVDFWKRMSVMPVQGQGDGGKESEWLAEAQGSRKGIKKWILIGLVILVLLIGGGIAYGVVASLNKPKSGFVQGKDA